MIVFKSSGSSWGTVLVSLLLLTAISAGLIYMASIVVRLLYLLGPLLLIAVAILDHRVLLDYLRWIGQTLRRRFIQGILVGILSLIGYPIVSAFLLMRAIFRRKVRQVQQSYEKQQQGELTDFEEIKSTPVAPTPVLKSRTDDDYVDFG